jgi:uncharacterized damage-inducible protein DinB
MLKRALLILTASAAPAFAQADANLATTTARSLWEGSRDMLVASASDVPESIYSFRPTPEVRTYGEIIGHVAGAQKMFCAMVLGEAVPSEDAVEKTAKTKAALIAALKESNTYCARAYQTTDKANTATIDLFGQQRSKAYALMMNVTHNNEHYGNLVTYMRINKIVPPSSRR